MKPVFSRSVVSFAATLSVLLLTSGCVTPTTTRSTTDQLPRPGAKIVLGTIVNETLHQFEFDVESELKAAMTDQLESRNLLASETPEASDFLLEISITDFRPGDAFKRWVMPGWGSTVVAVNVSLLELDGQSPAAVIDHRRTVAAGGFYTIGAEHTILRDLARDLAHDLEIRIAKGGDFVVEAGSRGDSVTTGGFRSELPPVWLNEVIDRRSETGRIGQRTAAFGVSMGDVYFSRNVPGFIRENLELELTADGHRLSREEGAIILNCELNRFWLHTDTTALYWDIVVEVAITLSEPGQVPGWTKELSAKASQRTYVWPSSSLCAKVIDDCVDDLMKQVRDDVSRQLDAG